MKAVSVSKAVSLSIPLLSAIYAILIWSWSFNFPNADDYTAILLPLIKYKLNPGFENFIAIAFEPHTQHLQVLLRFFVFLVWKVFGVINFQALIAIGLVSIPVLVWMIGKLSDLKHQALALVLATFAIAQPQYAEATLWATNAIPYLWINVFAAAAIYSRIQLGSWWSLLWAALSCLSWGNGIIVPFICFSSPKACSRWIRVSHLFLFGLFAFLQLKNPNTSGISRSISDIPSICYYFLRLVGSAPGYYSSQSSLFWGIFAICITAFLVFKLRIRQLLSSPLFLYAIFLAGSLFLCAITRVSEGAASAYTTSRYTLPSILLILVLILHVLETALDRKLIKVFAVTVAALFWIHSTISYSGFMRQRYELLNDSKARWSFFRNGLAGPPLDIFNTIHAQAETAGIIPIWTSSQTLENKSEIPVSKSSKEAIIQIEYLLTNTNALHVSGYFVPLDSKIRNFKSFLLLKAEDGARYAFPISRRDRPDVVLHLSQVQPELLDIDERSSGFSVFANTFEVPPGRYSMFVVSTDETTSQLSDFSSVRFDLKKTVEISHQ